MPKRPKLPRDTNQLAKFIVDRSVGEVQEPRDVAPRKRADAPKPPKGLSAYMSALGKRGGQVSGAKRMTNLSDEQRQTIALKAARARWAKAKQAKKR